MSRRLLARLPSALLLAAVTVFLLTAAPRSDLPGLHADEAREAGLPALQLLRGLPTEALRGVGLHIGGRTFPLMVQDYIGALNVYLAMPFVAILGPTPQALRALALALGLLTLVLTYAAAAESVGPLAAGLAALLLAGNPSFVFWQRQGIYVTSVAACLWLGACWAGARWARRGGWQAAGMTGALAGLATYAKLSAVWVIGGLVVAIAVINLVRAIRRTQVWPRRPTRAELIAGLVGFAIGVAPLLIYNLISQGTLIALRENLVTSYYGVDNRDVFANLAGRLAHFRAVLAGRDHLWYLGGSFGNPWTEWALVGAALWLVVARPRGSAPARGAFLPITLVVAWLMTAFTVSGLFPTHFAVVLPLAAMVIGAGLGDMVQAAASDGNAHRTMWTRLAGMAALGLVVLLVARDAWANVQYHRALERSGGLGPHSDAIYRLEDFLESRDPTAPVIIMDWGIAPQLAYLSAGRLQPVEIYGFAWEPDAEFVARLDGYLDDPDAFYVFHWPQETIFPRRQAFEALVAARGGHVDVLEDISRRDGAPVFQVVRVCQKPPEPLSFNIV